MPPLHAMLRSSTPGRSSKCSGFPVTTKRRRAKGRRDDQVVSASRTTRLVSCRQEKEVRSGGAKS